MSGESRKRRHGSVSTEKESVLDLDERRLTVVEDKPIAAIPPCVTDIREVGADSELDKSPPLSEDLPRIQGSTDNPKKEATEHDEADIADVKASSSTTVLSDLSTSAVVRVQVADSSPSNTTSNTSHTLVQSNDCVRTVAETSPMPDLFAQDDDGDTFLHISVVQGDQPLSQFFIERMKPRGIDIFNKLRQTPLHLAVITHQKYLVERLVEGGADVNLMDRHGQTALHLACQDGDINSVFAIRDVTHRCHLRIRLDLKNFQGFSALHVATLHGNKQLVETILDMGADINDQDSNSGRTALHHAVEAGKHHVTEYLISRGADVNKVTFAGNTPLHTACGRDMDQMVKLLIEHGANVNIANLEGDIPKVGQTSEQAKRHFRSKEKQTKRRKK